MFGLENMDGNRFCGREKQPSQFAEFRLALQIWRNVKYVLQLGGEMLAENGLEDFYLYETVSGCYSGLFVSRRGRGRVRRPWTGGLPIRPRRSRSETAPVDDHHQGRLHPSILNKWAVTPLHPDRAQEETRCRTRPSPLPPA